MSICHIYMYSDEMMNVGPFMCLRPIKRVTSLV